MSQRYLQALVVILLSSSPLWAKKFYWDDPLPEEPKLVNLGDVQVRKLGNYYDYFYYSLATPGELNTKQHAMIGTSSASIPFRTTRTIFSNQQSVWHEAIPNP